MLFRQTLQYQITRRMFSSLSRFDIDTTVKKVKDFHYRGEVTNRWSVGTAPNGGYLMMMAINAAKDTIEHSDPLSITAHYVNKALENHPVDITIRIVSKARSSTTVNISMTQNEEVKSEYLAVFGNLEKFKGFTFNQKPNLSYFPKREDCLSGGKILRKVAKHVKLFHEIEILLPKDDPFTKGLFINQKGEKALLNCWVKFEEKRKPCLSSFAFFLDALPPPVINLTPSFWVPTLEYTVHFWSKPEPEHFQSHNQQLHSLSDEQHHHHHHHQQQQQHHDQADHEDQYWLRGKFETVFSKNGMLFTDGEVWSADGKHLLATSRQLARVLDPK